MRVADDWIRHAAEAGAGADDVLDEALAATQGAWELRRLLEGALGAGLGGEAWRDRIAERLLAAARADRDVRAARAVAELRSGQGDEAAARAALAVGRLAAREGRAHGWCVLAEAWLALGDREEAEACLEDAPVARLQEACDVAGAYASRLGDATRAKALLEPLVPEDTHAAWTLANAWRELDAVRAGAVLDAALAAATTAGDAATAARALASHEDLAGRDRGLRKALDLASSARELLHVAEAAFDLDRRDLTAVALERAEAAGAPRDALRAAWRWIDPERADAMGAPGVLPEDLRPRLRELPGFTPSAGALFDRLRASLGEADLRDVAGADYGNDYDKHLAALRVIVATGRVPSPLPWEPGEVLQLVRWREGERVDHRVRAFCACVLCLTTGDLGNDLGNDVPIVVESALALGGGAPGDAAALMAWLYATADGDTAQLAALWGLALLTAAAGDPRVEDLAAVAEKTGENRERVVRYTLKAELWDELTARYLGGSEAWGRLLG